MVNDMRQVTINPSESMYIIEKINGRTYIIGITRTVEETALIESDYRWIGRISSADSDCSWPDVKSTIDALNELMTVETREAKRTRDDFDETLEWMQKLQLDLHL